MPTPLRLFSCGHIVPPSSVKVLTVSASPSNGRLNFQHTSRFDLTLLQSLHASLTSICQLVPHGVVVFFTSYKYMNFVLKSFKQSNSLNTICQTKRTFIEPQLTSDVEHMMTAYANAANRSGAILFCVMGGKLSEGINFTDNLARAVVCVGLPYADKREVVMKEKMVFYESLLGDSSRIYETMCMKIVNQCIGKDRDVDTC